MSGPDTRNEDSAPAHPRPATLTSPGRPSQPLFGRAAELAQLDAVFARALEYRAPQLVTLAGTQGVGKTRLLSEWLSALQRRTPAPVVYRGRAARDGGGPYALISRLLRDRFGILESDDAGRRLERVRSQVTRVFNDKRMTEVLHFLGRFLDFKDLKNRADTSDNAFIRAVTVGEDLRHEDAIARTVLRRFLELDAEHTPLVIAFDDLHLADDDSLTLLAELAEGLGGSPVVMVAAARPELFVRRPEWGQGNIDHSRIELGPLSRADSERLLRNILARAEPLPQGLIDDACELTGGNPFFIEELVRVFRESGTLTVVGDSWRIDPERAAQAELPMSVEKAIEARIAALSLAERELLERAASLGSVFWFGAMVVLQRADQTLPPGQPPSFALEERARLEAMLEELVERDYLLKTSDSSVPGEIEYIFKHNLEHGLIVKMISAERARRYHLLSAQWLESRLPPRAELTGEQLEFLASLYDKGGFRWRAAEAYLAAADKARERYANEAAAELYARGLALLDEGDALAKLDALHDHGAVLQLAGRAQAALAAFEAMLQAAWRLDHRAKAGAAHSRIARVHRSLGDYAKAESHLAQALALFRAAGDTRGVAATEDDLGVVAFLRGAYPVALEHHSRALDLRRLQNDHDPGAGRATFENQRSLALSLHNLALVHQACGTHNEALMRFSEALAIRREIGDRPGVVQSLLAVASAWRDRGDLERAFEVLGEALELAQEIGDRHEQASILTRMGEALWHLDRGPLASEHLQEADALARTLGNRLLQSEAARLLAEIQLKLGDVRAARADARRALELAEKVGSRPYAAMAHRVLGMVLSRGGATDEDRQSGDRHLTTAIEILGEVGAELELGRTYQCFADLLRERGDVDGAATFSERAGEIRARLALPSSASLDI